MRTLIHKTKHLQNYKLQLCLPKCDIFKCTPLRLIANLVAYQNPGIAAATSTRLDSAAKHIMACKVDSDLMMDFVSKNINGPSDKRREMHINKHKYCVFKNDLVLCTNKPLFPSDNNKSGHRQNAYPAVVSTLGDVELCCKKFLAMYYSYHSATAQMNFHMEASQKTDQLRDNFQDKNGLILNLPYFSAQGYALGTAWASDQTGDTVSSVLVGGMQTVMNGAFPCCAGEVLQWYFEFEEDMYYPKRIQVKDEPFHRESASRKLSGEEFQAGKAAEILDQWMLIDKVSGPVAKHNTAWQDLFSCLTLAKASSKQSVIEHMEKKPDGTKMDNNEFKIPGYEDKIFQLQCQDTPSASYQSASLTEFIRTGIVNSASKFLTFYERKTDASGVLISEKSISEAYNKGDTLRKRRREFNERMDGLGAEQKGNKAYPKPYRLYSSNNQLDDHYGDKIRIFAKCVSSARPHEMMDIMLMTQSL